MAIAIAIIVVLLLAGIVVFVTTGSSSQARTGFLSRETRSRDASARVSDGAVDEDAGRERSEETRRAGTPAVVEPGAIEAAQPIVTEEEIGISRRQFFNRGVVGATALGLAAFGAGSLAFLYPSSTGGFGGVVRTGRKLDEVLAEAIGTGAPAYFPEARSYVNPYPPEDVENAVQAGYPDSILSELELGYIVLYQKCVHLGCRVPWCDSSQWFECPCHGSKYNRVGQKRDGPAPRGLDMFRSDVGGDGVLSIDTSDVVTGMPIGTNTTGQRPEGPACV